MRRVLTIALFTTACAPKGPALPDWSSVPEQGAWVIATARPLPRVDEAAPLEPTSPQRWALVSHHEGWLAVRSETIAAGPHCVPPGDLDDVGYLPVDATLSVVTRPVRVAWDDGTQVDLAPGVPARPRPEARIRSLYEVEAAGFTLRVNLTPPFVGGWYVPGPPLELPSGELLLDRDLPPGSIRFGDGGVAAWTPGPLIGVADREEADDGWLATLTGPCLGLRARVPADAGVPAAEAIPPVEPVRFEREPSASPPEAPVE